MSKPIIGIDLGGTYIKAGIVTPDGEVIARAKAPTDAPKGPESVMHAMATAGREALCAANLEAADVAAAGVGAPGPMNWRTGVVYSPPNLPGWQDVPLAASMSERLGVPAFIENDANAACYAEYWVGAGRDVDTMILLTLGTGVGGGIVLNKKLLRGLDGTAGEIGHMTVMRDGRPCGCGNKGCLETYASVTGLVATAVEGLERGQITALGKMCNGDASTLTGKMVSDAIDQGDEFALWVMQETGRWLGTSIASLINLINPEKVILTGGMANAGATLLDTVIATAHADALDVPAARCEIGFSALGGDAGVIGAAGCAFERLADDATQATS
jgi:glucokinase